jgi:probable F420-dependent oxidoreductase
MSEVTGGGLAAMRSRLGAVGVFSAHFMGAPVESEPAAARELERLGYGSLWCGEILGSKDAFSHASVILASTSTLVYGTGIANVWSRHAATMEGGAATVGAAWPGQFVLGVGVSHAALINPSGQQWDRPLERMRIYLRDMQAAIAVAPECPVAVPRLLAALGPRVLELARDHADGAFPYFVPPDYVPWARAILGPEMLLVVEQAAVLATDAGLARTLARTHLGPYLAAFPNYTNNLRRMGYSDADLAGGGSDRLVDDLVIWGNEEAIARRVDQLRASGADTVLLQMITPSLSEELVALRSLAPAVISGPTSTSS